MSKKGYPGDEAIVEALTNQDDSVLHWVYKTCYPAIVKMVLQNSGNRDEAVDVFQDGVLVFYENIKDGTFELKSSISTYLYAVCRHLWLNRLREKGRYPMFVADVDENHQAQDEVRQFEEEEKRFEKLGNAIDMLGEPCRSLLKDFYYQDLSMTEIAEKFGYTNADNAKTQKYKCLQRLKKLYFK